MYPTIYAMYPIFEKVGYFEELNPKQESKMKKTTKKANTETIAEVTPTHASDSKESNQSSPVWRTKGKVTPINKMDDDFLRKAYFHSLRKIGEHSAELQRHERSLNTFMELNEHLRNQAVERGLDWIERVNQTKEPVDSQK